jgi:hypothetical protein
VSSIMRLSSACLFLSHLPPPQARTIDVFLKLEN